MTRIPRKLVKKVKKPAPKSQQTEGLAAAAEKNRELAARLRIVEAFQRLGISNRQWPRFVRDFATDPQQQIEYHDRMTPLAFQPPEFDPLVESLQDWATKADKAWELHRNAFVQQCKYFVKVGVDEEIVEARRVRGAGKKVPAQAADRSRGENTPIDLRHEWAAKRLIGISLKVIAGADAVPSTVTRVCRDILQLAGWNKKRSQRVRSGAGVP